MAGNWTKLTATGNIKFLDDICAVMSMLDNGLMIEDYSDFSLSGMYGELVDDSILNADRETVRVSIFVPEEKKHRFAQAYEWQETEGVLKPFLRSHLGEYYEPDVAFESGGAGLVSTLDDYSHFATMMLQKGMYKGKRILGKRTVEFMTQNHLSDHQRRSCDWDSVRGYGYGCLMRVLIDQTAAGTSAPIGEYGWDGWMGAYVTMVPEEDLILLYFIQRCGAGMTPVVRKLRMATFAACEELN